MRAAIVTLALLLLAAVASAQNRAMRDWQERVAQEQVLTLDSRAPRGPDDFSPRFQIHSIGENSLVVFDSETYTATVCERVFETPKGTTNFRHWKRVVLRCNGVWTDLITGAEGLRPEGVER